MTSDGGGCVEVINVAIDARTCSRYAPGAWLEALADAIGDPAGPRLTFLPPLLCNVAALPATLGRLPIGRATAMAALARPARVAAVLFSYPKLKPKRLRWAVMHDRVEEVLRGALADFAERAGTTVITTALADHPRIHWEAWPERGDVYHCVRTLTPEGGPDAVMRQRRPTSSFRGIVDIDPEDTDPGSTLSTDAGKVGIVWDSSSYSVPTFKDPPVIVWHPNVAGPADEFEPASLLRGLTGTKAVVSTGACQWPGKSSTTYTRDTDGHIMATGSTEELSEGVRFSRVFVPV